MLQDLVLPERQEPFQNVLAQRESNQDGLPWEEGTVQETRELLHPRQEINGQSSFTNKVYWHEKARLHKKATHLEDIHDGRGNATSAGVERDAALTGRRKVLLSSRRSKPRRD